jgi:hypothetical protein
VTEFTPEQKETFKDASKRRRDRGIRLKQFAVRAEESQVIALSELYEAWLERWGKEDAIDRLIRMWAHAEARIRDQEHAKKQT